MSTDVWGTLWSQPGLTETTTLLSSCKRKAQEGKASPMPWKNHQGIAPSTGHTSSTRRVQKTVVSPRVSQQQYLKVIPCLPPYSVSRYLFTLQCLTHSQLAQVSLEGCRWALHKAWGMSVSHPANRHKVGTVLDRLETWKRKPGGLAWEGSFTTAQCFLRTHHCTDGLL